MAKQAVVPPELNIPPSDHTVEVSVINSARISHLPSKFFMSPSIPGYDVIDAPCYSFLIKRKNAAKPGKYDQMVFDLGIRKDWRNGPQSVVDRVIRGGYKIEVDRDVAETLGEGGEDLGKIGAIIWSHGHFVRAVVSAHMTALAPGPGPHRRSGHVPTFHRLNRRSGFQERLFTCIPYEPRRPRP